MTISAGLVQKPTAVALGNFDGVHRGHDAVLHQVLDHPHSTVLTFEPHPREYFRGEQGFLLTPGAEKSAALAHLGISQVVVLPFTSELARLSAPDFVQKILVELLGAERVSIGADFHFGYQRGGNAQLLAAWGKDYGFQVQICSHVQWGTERISSSAIRAALSEGDLVTASRLLGRTYTLIGTVIHGAGRGRTIGVPTANLAVSARKFCPRHGVYAVRVYTKGSALGLGVMNIGVRPTIEQSIPERSIEVHVLDWQGDLYDQSLTVELLHFIRPEQKFNSLSELQGQIQRDIIRARSLGGHPVLG